MKKSNKKSTGKFKPLSKGFWTRKTIAFVLIFAAVAGVAIYKSFAATGIVIKGRVTVNGVGVKDVYIDGCGFNVPGYGVAAITDANGYFTYAIKANTGQGYCSRVFWTDYLPSTNVAVAHNKLVLKGVTFPPKTVNRSAYANVGRYEFQIAGLNCYGAGSANGCNPNGSEQKWDLASDTGFSFAFTGSYTPPPPTTTGSCPLPASGSLSSASTYTGTATSGKTIDARNSVIASSTGWLVTPKGSNVCWLGGEIKNTISDSSTGSPENAWANYWHRGGGFDLKYASGWKIDSASVSHTGDAFNISSGGSNFEIRNSHAYDIRDDCVQNDYYLSGTIHDNFFEGCYSGISSKASANTSPNGSGHTMSVTNNLIWLKPMYSVYKGDSPGVGHLIKWAKPTSGLGTPEKLVFENNVVRIDKCPFQSGSSCSATYFPTNAVYNNNALYWGGSGSPPAELVSLFSSAHNSRIITKTQWDQAVSLWKAAHPGVK